MKTLILTLTLFAFMTSITIFQFSNTNNLDDLQIVDDVVMGGTSNGNFQLNKDGHAVFSGEVSLENNGGFSSVQYTFDALNFTNYKTVCIKLKGDGNNYQFRLKKDQNDYYSYKKEFTTNGDWQTVKLQLANLQPIYRGRSLDMPNFDSKSIEQLTFLIANKKPQSFKLVLDKIWLEQIRYQNTQNQQFIAVFWWYIQQIFIFKIEIVIYTSYNQLKPLQ